MDLGTSAAALDAARDRGEPLPEDGVDVDGGSRDHGVLTVGRLAAHFGLSRSTLLYYDRIGLLRPSARSAAGYRHYGSADVARLASICHYRRAGLPLAVIARLLGSPHPDLVEALATQVTELDDEIRRLRAQQRFILASLRIEGGLARAPFLSGDQLVELLERTGVSAEQRVRWHAAFEALDGDQHQAFLEFLCIEEDTIAALRGSPASADAKPPHRPLDALPVPSGGRCGPTPAETPSPD